MDSYIKLIYLRSRWYDPASGRFTTRDSWQGDYNRPLSLNRWNYVEGNPIINIDPSGHWICTVDTTLLVNRDCTQWIEDGLQKLKNSGTVGRNIFNFFERHDKNLKWSALGGCVAPALAGNIWGVRFAFAPVKPIDALAITLWPNTIIFDSSDPEFRGQSASPRGVVTLGHEITHLAQRLGEFSVQAEVLSSLTTWYLEAELTPDHRPDGQWLRNEKINPWSDKHLAYANENVDLGGTKKGWHLPFPLRLGWGIPSDWFSRWGITLPYATPKE